MLNYELPQQLLLPHLPRGTELDLWQGRCLASVVGFRFLRTRVLGLPIPFHCNFDEVNLRFYTRRHVNGEQRRGVTFVREVVPRFAIAWVARTLYNENYVSRKMRSQVSLPPQGDGHVAYRWWERGEALSVEATVVGEPSPLIAGSEEEFIAEHYWGYSKLRDGSTMEYEVQHPPWRVWQGQQPRLTGPIEHAYGEEMASYLRVEPVSAFVAEGSAVSVSGGVRFSGGQGAGRISD